MDNEFQCIGRICIYRSFNFHIYLNCWFSLSMAKRGIEMILALKYSNNKKKREKKIEKL